MSKGTILVTDTLFIFDEHVKKLETAGYEVERLDKPDASEAELCEAIKGKVGYILGGIEKVTAPVFEAADQLKVMVFTGADWEYFIPGWQKAVEKGVAIANAPGPTKYAVSEYAVAVALAMQRNLFELGRTGDKSFQTTGTFKDAVIGVIGAGRIGERIISLVQAFGPKKVMYWSRDKKDIAAEYADFEEVASQSDIIFMAVPSACEKSFDAGVINSMKAGALLVSISPLNLLDLDALLIRLQKEEVRAAIDWPAPNAEFSKLPLHIWHNSNAHTAYNTHQAAQVASNMSTESIINLLETGKDQYRVK